MESELQGWGAGNGFGLKLLKGYRLAARVDNYWTHQLTHLTPYTVRQGITETPCYIHLGTHNDSLHTMPGLLQIIFLGVHFWGLYFLFSIAFLVTVTPGT